MNIKLQDAPLPENAISPARWAVFTLWQHTPEEKDIEFVQRTEVLSPSGEKFAEITTTFKITENEDLQSKNHVEILGLPIGTEGFLKIRVWLEGVADTTGEYQFLIKYLPKEKHEEQPVTADSAKPTE